jgi:hypothetical protein
MAHKKTEFFSLKTPLLYLALACHFGGVEPQTKVEEWDGMGQIRPMRKQRQGGTMKATLQKEHPAKRRMGQRAADTDQQAAGGDSAPPFHFARRKPMIVR